MDRINEHSLYSSNKSVYQTGGDPRSPKSPKSPKNNKSSYRPADVDGETSSAIDKFRKANRELKRDYEKIKKELQKANELNNKLKKELEASKLN
tara:strand:- start:802 stop:1083 length:282 start_codon:yes stop_codon:yes gene_type:complete